MSRSLSQSGGLHTLFSIVMAGLVGSTPHMVSAAVLALARLLFEFAPRLQSTAPALLPAVLMLLRTKSRETVKAVLGFIKVGREPENTGCGPCGCLLRVCWRFVFWAKGCC